MQQTPGLDVVNPLEHTPWGAYRFVVRDPDGHLLAIAQDERR